MTDTIITPVAGPEAPLATTQEPVPAPAAAEVDHTPGGWPVVPLAVTGTNTTTSLMAAAALVGGPVALALAATGAVVIGATAAARNRRDQRRNVGGRASGKGARGAGSSRSAVAGRVPKQQRPGAFGKSGSTGRTGGKPGRAAGGRGSRGGAAAATNRKPRTAS
ncbi:hypothetical protein ACFWSO_30745, partial [Streptomyces sp. NPDC058572]